MYFSEKLPKFVLCQFENAESVMRTYMFMERFQRYDLGTSNRIESMKHGRTNMIKSCPPFL